MVKAFSREVHRYLACGEVTFSLSEVAFKCSPYLERQRVEKRNLKRGIVQIIGEYWHR